jgi:propanediol dehydratase large subunit
MQNNASSDAVARYRLAFHPTAQRHDKDRTMRDPTQGIAADAGQAAQTGINQICDAQEQLVTFIRDNPISAALLAVGTGYLLGKIL